jgi:Na+/serine symporter
MAKFCPSCGANLPPDVKFCSNCGERIDRISIAPQTRPINLESAASIIVGILVIAVLYTFPIGISFNRNYTIAEINAACNSALGQIAQLAFQSNECGFYNAIFIIGWISGLILIIIGIAQYLRR